MGLGLDAGGDAEEDLGGGEAVGDEGVEPVELVEAVDDDPADAGLDRFPQLGRRLVVAMEGDPVGGDAGREADVELAAAGHVEAEAFLVDQPGHGPAEERLGGVDGVGSERFGGFPASGSEVIFVVDEERGAELPGQLGRLTTADEELPVGPDGGVVGEE